MWIGVTNLCIYTCHFRSEMLQLYEYQQSRILSFFCRMQCQSGDVHAISYYVEVDEWVNKTTIHILIHYVCNARFHWLWRRKFAALKSLRLCHESSDDVTSLATQRSNVTKTFWKSVLSEWIRMVITRFVFEWFAGINCIILQSQIPVLPLRWRVAVKLNLRP